MLLLVRHGETAVNSAGRLQGRADAALTELGRDQAARLAAAVSRWEPSAVVSSPLRRAHETAAAIADAVGMHLEIDERLVELHYGDWDGRSFAELPDGAFARWRADPGFAPPGGESLGAVRERVVPCLEELLAHPGVVVAVSHVTPIKAAVTWALDVGDGVAWRMHLGLASITRLELRQGSPCLLSFDETSHLL